MNDSKTKNKGFFTGFVIACLVFFLSGCTAVQMERSTTRDALQALTEEVSQLTQTNGHTQEQVVKLTAEQSAVSGQLKTQTSQVLELQKSVAELPRSLTALCPNPTIATATCDSAGLRRVIISGDKMVVGELERVWLDPPGLSLTARVDTGAFSNSLNAEGLIEFERDGDDWVRFYVSGPEEESRVQIERRVLRWVRVFQQADREGSRRPMVKMRLLLGDVEESFEFTLADRSHLEYQILLGRNFLTDIALVDVGRQFVQPPYVPPKKIKP
ncbi:MAG: RimK/LysX family protein [Pseudomonadales bacterium]|nr:RimK/LysX family protein [Pseudomonadales bacterium]